LLLRKAIGQFESVFLLAGLFNGLWNMNSSNIAV